MRIRPYSIAYDAIALEASAAERSQYEFIPLPFEYASDTTTTISATCHGADGDGKSRDSGALVSLTLMTILFCSYHRFIHSFIFNIIQNGWMDGLITTADNDEEIQVCNEGNACKPIRNNGFNGTSFHTLFALGANSTSH